MTHGVSGWPKWLALTGAFVALAWLVSACGGIAYQRRIQPAEITHDEGHAWLVRGVHLPWWLPAEPDDGRRLASPVTVLEDTTPLAPGHAEHAAIRRDGRGFSHWGDDLWFATGDGSDPRTNGHAYALRVPVRLSWAWLAAGLAAIALATAPLVHRRRIDLRAQRAIHTASGIVIVAIAGLLAVCLGWFTIAPPHSHTPLQANDLQPWSPPFPDTGAPTRWSWIDLFGGQIDWRFPPFFTGDWATLAQGGTRLLADGEAIPHGDGAPAEEHAPGTFIVSDTLLVVRMPADHRVANWTIDARITPSRGAWSVLALLAATGGWLWVTGRRLTGGPTRLSYALLRVVIGAPIPTAATLLTLTAIGSVTAPLAAPFALTDELAVFGPEDRTLRWAEARTQLARRTGETDGDYVQRLNGVVADAMAHVWDRRHLADLRMQVPATANWLLWLAGEITPSRREFHFADPRHLLERGVGLCGHIAYALAALLREAGFDARMVELSGHSVVAVPVGDEAWLADPDFRVVLPMSLAEAEAVPERVRAAYADSSVGPRARVTTDQIDLVVAAFAPPNFVGPPDLTASIPPQNTCDEGLAEALRWWLPIATAAPWLIAILRPRRNGARSAVVPTARSH